MQYNPQYCTIVVRNTDGSGYLRQFETLAEAKDAYASISASGASVYLYQPPTKSLAEGDASTPPPPPISSTGSEVVENGVTRNPFEFIPTDNIFTQTMSRVGCVVGRMVDADGQEIFGPVYPKYIFQESGVTVDEKLGEINSNGCYYPNGFRIEFNGQQRIYFSVQTLNSLDYAGNIYGPYYEVSSMLGWGRNYVIANGDGTTSVEETIGIPWTRQQDKRIIEWEFYQNGDTPYSASTQIDFSDWVKIGQPTPNGSYLVTYKVPPDDRIHSGYWIASIINAETSPKVKWVFEPAEPDQPPPPPCSITKKVINPDSGIVDDECDPDIVYPFTVEEDCEPPVTAVIEGQTVTLGRNKKVGMNNGYGDIVWGECSGMIYLPYGTPILSVGAVNYFSDGEGSYYSEGSNPCDAEGTIVSFEDTDITVVINNSTYTVGQSYERTVADGNCGTTLEVGTNYLPYGTFITEYEEQRYLSDGAGSVYACLTSGQIISSSENPVSVYISELDLNTQVGNRPLIVYSDGSCGTYESYGDTVYYPSGTQIASGNGYLYFSDGSGGYYSEEEVVNCDDYGVFISESSIAEQVYISEIGSSFDSGSTLTSTYADGNCGTYTESSTTWYDYGTQIASDSSYNYFSDGNGGYYLEEISNECDGYGTFISENSSDATVYISEIGSDYTAGYYSESTYADGSCGTYTESSTTWYDYGTYITNYGGNNFYLDGNGGYYYESDGSGDSGGGGGECDPYGTYLYENNYDATIYISELGSDYTAGSTYESTYADGNCGTYTESGTSWYEYGYLLASDGSYNYFSDGNGYYYSE